MLDNKLVLCASLYLIWSKKVKYRYKYSLNKENMYDLQLEAAYADKQIKKKMMILLLNFLLIPSTIIVIIMNDKTVALIISIIYVFICLLSFPFIYWKRVRTIVKTELEKMNFNFDQLLVEFTEKYLSVVQQDNKFCIYYDQIEGYKITNHNFMLFYCVNDRKNCLIFPYLVVKKELNQILQLIKENAKEKRNI